MTLDPEMRTVLDALAAAPTVDVFTLPPLEAARRLRTARSVPVPACDLSVLTEDIAIDGPGDALRLRIYRPVDNAPTGVLVNCHGGGWVQGSIETDDVRCRALLRASGAVVVSVGYRLAPEHPFPAALDDCRAALRWAWSQRESLAGSDAILAVGGSSAGANLAFAAARAERDTVPVALQVLISPVCDDDFDRPSYIENAEGFHLTRRMMRWFWEQYAQHPEDRASEHAALLRSADFAGTAPTLMIVAEYDPLRDEAIALAERLRGDGVAVRLSFYPGAIHAFPSLAPGSALARQAFAEIGGSLKQAFETNR